MYISRGVRLHFQNKLYFFFKTVTLKNSDDLDEMPICAAFDLGLHCL